MPRPTPARSGQDGSLPLVLLVALVVGTLVVSLFATMLSGQSRVQFNQAHTEAIAGAEAGVNQAVTYLSQMDPDDNRDSLTSADVSGANLMVGDVSFEWTANRVGPVDWQVRGVGTQRDVVRNVEAIVSRDVVFFLAAFGDTSFEMRGANNATSYNATAANTGNGAVGTNNALSLSGVGTQNVDLVSLMNTDDYSCNGGACSSIPVESYPDDFDMGELDDLIREQMGEACTSGFSPFDGSYPLEGGNTYCFSSINAGDINTVDASSENPIRVFVDGNISISNHSEVNCEQGCTLADLPDSRSLQVYSVGDQVRLGNQSEFVWALAAPSASCTGNPSNAQADIFGALICNDLSNQGGWDFHFDDRLVSVGEGTYEVQQWREELGDGTSFVTLD